MGGAERHRGRVAALTPKEREVVRLLATGHTTTEIAALTERHPSTVHEHLVRIRERLGVRTEAQIGAYAVCAGIVECAAVNP